MKTEHALTTLRLSTNIASSHSMQLVSSHFGEIEAGWPRILLWFTYRNGVGMRIINADCF
jgi:hypothetical protein